MLGHQDTPLDKILDWVYIIFCFEIGLFLIFTPWMRMWEDNSLLQHFPILQPILLNNFIRGAITGLGISDLYIGTLEVILYYKRTKHVGTP